MWCQNVTVSMRNSHFLTKIARAVCVILSQTEIKIGSRSNFGNLAIVTEEEKAVVMNAQCKFIYKQ